MKRIVDVTLTAQVVILRNDGQPRLTFSGIGVYAPSLFAGIGRDARAPLAPLLRDAAARSRAGAERHRGAWTDVGTPQRLAERQCSSKCLPSGTGGKASGSQLDSGNKIAPSIWPAAYSCGSRTSTTTA